MYTFLGTEITISVFSLDLKSNSLDTCYISFQIVQHLDFISSLFSPAAVHTIEHACPVHCLCTACTCMKCHDCIICIIRSDQKCADSQFLKDFLKCSKFLFNLFCGFLLLVFSCTHFNQKKHIFIICK